MFICFYIPISIKNAIRMMEEDCKLISFYLQTVEDDCEYCESYSNLIYIPGLSPYLSLFFCCYKQSSDPNPQRHN